MRKLLPPPGTLRKAWVVAFAALVLLWVLAGVIWYIMVVRLDEQFTRLVEADAFLTKTRVETMGRDATVAYRRQYFTPEKTEAVRESMGLIVLLADENYRPLAGNLSEWPEAVGTKLGTQNVTITYNGRKIQARLNHQLLVDGSHSLQGRDMTDHLWARSAFYMAFLLISITLFSSVLLLGYLIRKSLLEEIADIGRAAGAMMSGNLTKRVTSQKDDRELTLLSSTINQMLEHIEKLVDGIKNVSNEIAHELRTPLAQVRARIERLMEQTGEESAVTAELKFALADIDFLIRTFNALLRLAQIEAKGRQSGFRLIELPEIVAEAAEFYQHAAEAKQVNLKSSIPAKMPIHGDPVLVAQAVANLIDNAIKYTPAGGSIEIVLERGLADGAIIRVDDTGPGIPEAELMLVTGRFYRGIGSRGKQGSGLGLSLVAAIASLHRGDLRLANGTSGLRAVLGLQTGSEVN